MANLIYRGISHTGTEYAAPRMAHDLIYRGVAHDGLATETPVPASQFEMCYRGVAHGLGATKPRATGPRSAAQEPLALAV